MIAAVFWLGMRYGRNKWQNNDTETTAELPGALEQTAVARTEEDHGNQAELEGGAQRPAELEGSRVEAEM